MLIGCDWYPFSVNSSTVRSTFAKSFKCLNNSAWRPPDNAFDGLWRTDLGQGTLHYEFDFHCV